MSSTSCRECGNRTRIIDSRINDDGATRRRRACTECGARHSTIEVSVEAYGRLQSSLRALRMLRIEIDELVDAAELSL